MFLTVASVPIEKGKMTKGRFRCASGGLVYSGNLRSDEFGISDHVDHRNPWEEIFPFFDAGRSGRCGAGR